MRLLFCSFVHSLLLLVRCPLSGGFLIVFSLFILVPCMECSIYVVVSTEFALFLRGKFRGVINIPWIVIRVSGSESGGSRSGREEDCVESFRIQLGIHSILGWKRRQSNELGESVRLITLSLVDSLIQQSQSIDVIRLDDSRIGIQLREAIRNLAQG